jgi:hypothetical protein
MMAAAGKPGTAEANPTTDPNGVPAGTTIDVPGTETGDGNTVAATVFPPPLPLLTTGAGAGGGIGTGMGAGAVTVLTPFLAKAP